MLDARGTLHILRRQSTLTGDQGAGSGGNNGDRATTDALLAAAINYHANNNGNSNNGNDHSFNPQQRRTSQQQRRQRGDEAAGGDNEEGLSASQDDDNSSNSSSEEENETEAVDCLTRFRRLLTLEHEHFGEPTTPVHPALEYETTTTTVVASERLPPCGGGPPSTSLPQSLPGSTSPTLSSLQQQRNSKNLRLLDDEHGGGGGASSTVASSSSGTFQDHATVASSITRTQVIVQQLSSTPQELLAQQQQAQQQQQQRRKRKRKKRKDPNRDLKLLLSFLGFVVAGTGNVVTTKLQAIPMYNYPNFLNLWINLLYIPVCFCYILPTAKFGWFHNAILPEHMALPKRPFMIMGLLDCLATSLQVFSSVYLPGPLLVLLPQAAIPLCMILSRYLLQERYRWTQYLGAVIVVVGILVVLEPVMTNRRSHAFYCEAVDMEQDCTLCQVETTREACLSHWVPAVSTPTSPPIDNHTNFATTSDMRWLYAESTTTISISDDVDGSKTRLCQWLPFDEATREGEFLVFVWSLIMLGSCIPMCISTVYKQVALNAAAADLDPIFLNGWIALYQLFFASAMAIPAGMLNTPHVAPSHFFQNMRDGFDCYLGRHGSVEEGCHPDVQCDLWHANLFVNLNLVFTVLNSFFMLLLLKYGSSPLLFLALTIMVPLGNLAFSLPFIPQATTPQLSDILGLIVIITGLVLYRFTDKSMDGDAATVVAAVAPSEDARPQPQEGEAIDRENDHSMFILEEVIGEEEEDEEDSPTFQLWPDYSRSDMVNRFLRQPLLTGDV